LKRLFLAAALALMIHGFLLSLGLDPAKPRPAALPRTATLTLAFPQRDQTSLNPFPSSGFEPYLTKSAVATEPSHGTTEKAPLKKKLRSTLDRRELAAISLKELSTPRMSESEAGTTAPGIHEEVSGREGSGQTEDADGGRGVEGSGDAGPGGTQAAAGPGSGYATGNGSTHPSSTPIREATPRYRTNPPPEYPAIARRRGYEGIVLVEVLVSREGRVQELRLSQSSGYSVLDQAAMASMKGWLFEPATINEAKVEMWVKVPVRFHLK
jgi:protein TonB